MPSHSVSCRSRLRTFEVWLLIALAWTGLLLAAAGCRDTREDTNYCKSCVADNGLVSDSNEGTSSSSQQAAASVPGSSASKAPTTSPTDVSTGSAAMMSQQPAAANSGSSGSSASGVPAAGSRASNNGGVRDAGTSSGS